MDYPIIEETKKESPLREQSFKSPEVIEESKAEDEEEKNSK